MNITITHVLDAEAIGRFYDFYTAAFHPVRTMAAARHLLSAEEFTAEMTDPRIDKYVAWSTAGIPVGLTTLTTDLTAVQWIEPEFYTAYHAEPMARGALFYLGYILVDPRAANYRVFKSMADAVCVRVAETQGVLAFDLCAYNARRAVGRFVAGVEDAYGARVNVVDTQTFYTADFSDAAGSTGRSSGAAAVPRQRPATIPDTTAKTALP